MVRGSLVQRYWMVLLIFAVLTVGSSVSLYAGPAPATGVTGSMHDIGAVPGYNADQNGRVCIFCHNSEDAATSPSVGYPSFPNYNHPLSTINLAPYIWGSASNLNIPFSSDPLIGQSSICISCHDGVTAVDTHGGDGTANNGDHKMTSSYIDGLGNTVKRYIDDLSTTHPIGFNYADAYAARGSSQLYDIIKDGTTYVESVGAGTLTRG